MDIILLEHVKKLGDLGDVVSVRAGFGRNFLIPQGKALSATEGNRKVYEERKAELLAKAAETMGAAKARAEGIAGKSITVQAQASDEGKLYGSIGPNEIADAAIAAGIAINRAEVDLLDGPIRTIGEHQVSIHLHGEVQVALTVNVEAQARGASAG